MTYLETLPVLPLEEIASHLGFEDQVSNVKLELFSETPPRANRMNYDLRAQVSLASTHPNLLFLMPKEQNVVGVDFTKSGPYDGHFCPETYMDVPILTRGLISVKMSFRWQDQGFSCFVFLWQLFNKFWSK